MSGYTPVFRSVFEGTLCGQYPDTAAWLFLLALADKHGHVDKTPQYISAVTGMPVADLVGCIERFMEPDPASRSDAEEGRRLVPIDPERSWGWKIVNHEKYREKARKAASDAERVASGRDAERKRLERERAASRAVPRSPAESRSVRLSDADADTDSDKLRSDSGSTLSASESDRAHPEPLIAIENRKRLKQLTEAAVKTVPRRGR